MYNIEVGRSCTGTEINSGEHRNSKPHKQDTARAQEPKLRFTSK